MKTIADYTGIHYSDQTLPPHHSKQANDRCMDRRNKTDQWTDRRAEKDRLLARGATSFHAGSSEQVEIEETGAKNRTCVEQGMVSELAEMGTKPRYVYTL